MKAGCVRYSLAKVDKVTVDLRGVAPGHGAEAAGDHQRQREALPVTFPPQHAAEALLTRTLQKKGFFMVELI